MERLLLLSRLRVICEKVDLNAAEFEHVGETRFLVLVTREGVPLYVNKAWVRWLGWGLRDFAAAGGLSGLTHAEDQHVLAEYHDKLRHDVVARPMVLRLRIKSLSNVYLHVEWLVARFKTITYAVGRLSEHQDAQS